jgi:hypothetical protein
MFDAYSLKARVYPMVLVFFPIVVLGTFYSVEYQSYTHALTSIGLTGALCFLFSQLGRDAGKKKEKDLWKSWGGMPSLLVIRLSDAKIDKHTKERYHKKLYELCPVSFQTSEATEQANPDACDEVYRAWSKFLISKTRDTKKYSLLFKDNISYGFRRNLWGLKTLAIFLIILLIGINYGYWALQSHTFNPALLPKNVIYSSAFLLLILLFWCFIVTKSWVRIPADSYAERLYEATDQLE